ncbi:MAG TPA: serine hydrolase [Trebonia sp.]|nr:serine hydrolase [Trebonia sp.]
MTRRQRSEDLTTFALPGQPAVSPDGRDVVYVVTAADARADKVTRSLWHAWPAGAGEPGDGDRAPRRLTRGPADSCPAWSPDGTRVAFLRAGDGPAQLWLLPMTGGEPERLTTLALGAGAPAWSPDGTKLAFTAPVDPANHSHHTSPADPMVADRLGYQADGAGLIGAVREHLHVLDLATGDCRQVTEGDWRASAPVWSPDSARLAFGAAMAPDADLDYRCPVYVVDVTGGFTRPEPVALARGAGVPAAWSPGGDALFVVGTIGRPAGHASLLRIPLTSGGAASGGVVDLTASLDRNVMPGGPGYPGGMPALADRGATVFFCARDRGCTSLYAMPADGSGPARPVVAGPGRVVSGLSVAAAPGTAVVTLGTPDSYGEIVAVDLATGTRTVVTDHGAAQAEAELFPREEREFAISDGTTVHGWLIRDPAAPRPGPLLIDIHGGPHNAWNGAADPVHLYHQELAARGWTVLLVNPRGSDGYGAAFYTAVAGAWGVADARDFLEPVDALVAEGLADPSRLAVTGYSYGGYMTCYLTSRDGRFAAAVAGGPVTDLASMAGTSDDGHLVSIMEFGGTLAETLGSAERGARFAAMSPLTRVADVRTPTLILHGGADMRCPVGQAQQWHTALREQRVPARLVLYPGESHLFVLDGAPSHRIDYNQRVVDWVEQYTSDTRRPPIDAAHWRRRLATLAERHKVPGAALGILRTGRDGRPDELVTASCGYANQPAGVAATDDTLFQIGSITKVWTATLAMQLVDEGKLDLDAPVAEVLPELRLAGPDVAKSVTMRHLLTHTSGIDGDVFTDTGRGDDCVEKYVALLADVKQNHPLGATWSYCNAGFVLAGRVIEKLTGLTWDAALRERIFTPLGLTRTVTLPEEALRFRAAAGHVDSSGERAVAPIWTLPRSIGPAGLICSTPADMLAFARMHLAGGLAADGRRLLSEAGAAAMASHQADLPDKYVLGDSWGIGWIRFGWDGQRLLGHDGNTIGQSAFLRLLPEEGLAVTLLTNGGNARDLYQDLYAEIFAELAGVAMPAPIEPPAAPAEVDVTPYLGVYEQASVRMEVLPGEAGPVLRTTVIGPLAEITPDPVTEYAMTAVGPGLYVVREPETRTWVPVTFYTLPGGQPYLHHGARAVPKAG